MSSVTISISQSGNKNSALSKKCRKLEELAAAVGPERVKLGKILKVIIQHDIELGKVLTAAEVDEVVKTGKRPGRGKKGGVTVQVEI